MFKTKKEIENLIKAFNSEKLLKIRANNYLDHINHEDLDGCDRFKFG